MRHESFDPTCGVCRKNAGEESTHMKVLWENDRWLVRHNEPPHGVPGWMTLFIKRHLPEPAALTEDEAADFGLKLRWLESNLKQATGAERIYTASMSESFPHFHCHMVPRYANPPGDARAFGVFDLLRQAREGTLEIDAQEVNRLAKVFGDLLNS